MKRYKIIVTAALSICLSVGLCQTFNINVQATKATQDKIDQKEQEKADTEQKLENTQTQLDNLRDRHQDLRSELNGLNADLEEVSKNLQQLEGDIENKQQEITTTEEELAEAISVEQNQYETMKKRIQFIYECGDDMYVELLLTASSFSDFLNKADYIEQLSAYDRKMLKSYTNSRENTEAARTRLYQEKSDLELLKTQAQEQKESVQHMVESTSNNIANYADQISDAEKDALAYENQIKQQESDLSALYRKLEEEIALSKLAAASAKRDISEVTFDDGDRYLLANLIYCEAGGEPYEGQVAVGAVVINRVLSSVYPDTVVGVIYQSGQFSPVASGRLALALASDKATASCYQAADEAMSGVTNVGDCVYFRTPIEGLTGISIGGHIFY